eukprot:scaffold235305_cov39-Attheya_sp.AAC.1
MSVAPQCDTLVGFQFQDQHPLSIFAEIAKCERVAPMTMRSSGHHMRRHARAISNWTTWDQYVYIHVGRVREK